MRPVPTVSDVELAFPTTVATPAREEIPAEWWEPNPWSKLGSDLFLRLVDWTALRLLPRDGVNAPDAWRAICECMGSWGFPHQHKLAALGYLFNEWYEDYWFDGDTQTRIGNQDIPEGLR